MNLTLVIMAAGIGSRYGGVKQLESIGPSGETIMDYSIHDAVNAGFNKIVFIIREELQEAFDEHYKNRFKGKIPIIYVYQDRFKKYEEGYTISRTKPWGTGHALLSTEDSVFSSFAILNADDFYGKMAFHAMAKALLKNDDERQFYLLGYKIINTLSDYGTVSRGLCHTNEMGYLKDIRELTKIGKKNDGIYYDENGALFMMQPNDLVSMNFWGFTPAVYKDLKMSFEKFIKENHQNPKAEFYIPSFVDEIIKNNIARVKVISTDETWLGVTYREDKPIVVAGIRKLIERGDYPQKIG